MKIEKNPLNIGNAKKNIKKLKDNNRFSVFQSDIQHSVSYFMYQKKKKNDDRMRRNKSKLFENLHLLVPSDNLKANRYETNFGRG